MFPFQAFGGLGCPPTALCSWDPTIPDSWEDNRKQNGVQAFYLVNRFRDHLANDPNIAFDGFRDADAVLVETDDGASTGGAGPNGQHINNASMTTLPEGTSPRMQLFLFVGSGFRTVNGGDSAAIVWHEYTHGLSNRLVVHDDGSGALSSPQAGAMGEGWSDWYALDLLVGDGLMNDTSAPGDVDVGHYVDLDPHQVRRQGIDCPVGVVDPRCPARRLHLRRLRPHLRRRRGARRRRDLGPDAVGPAQGGRPRHRAGADHRGHADGAAGAVVPRHAQRDPRGRRRPRRREPQRDLAGVRAARDGLPRRTATARTTSRRTRTSACRRAAPAASPPAR